MSNPSTPPTGGEVDPLAELLAVARAPHDQAAERNTWLNAQHDEAAAVRAALYAAGRWHPGPGEPFTPAGWAAAIAATAPLIERHDLAAVYDGAADDDHLTRLAKAVVRAARDGGTVAVLPVLANATGLLEADVRERLARLAGTAGDLLAGRIAAADRERWPDLAEPLEPDPATVAEEPEGEGESGGGGVSRPPSSAKRRGVPRYEAEVLVADWLRKHTTRTDPESWRAATVARIAADTGVSTGQFVNLGAWVAFKRKRDELLGAGERARQLTGEMVATIPDDKVVDPAAEALARLIAEQKEDEASDRGGRPFSRPRSRRS